MRSIKKGFVAFIPTMIILFFIGCVLFPIDDNNTLQAPDWYIGLMMVVPILVSIVSAKVVERVDQKKRPATKTTHKENEKQIGKEFDSKRKELEIKNLSEEFEQKVKKQADEFNRKSKELENLNSTVKEARIQLSNMERDLSFSKESLEALRETEYQLLDWVSRVEKKERSIFEEMLKDADKIRKFQIQMDGFEFEEYTASLLKKNGYINVSVTQKSGDYGADVLAEKDGITYVFQCKYYTSMVGIEAVQQVYSAKRHYSAHIAVVVTNNIFTKAAKILADELKVLLWDCEELNKLEKST